jgi:hypothetical protein
MAVMSHLSPADGLCWPDSTVGPPRRAGRTAPIGGRAETPAGPVRQVAGPVAILQMQQTPSKRRTAGLCDDFV